MKAPKFEPINVGSSSNWLPGRFLLAGVGTVRRVLILGFPIIVIGARGRVEPDDNVTGTVCFGRAFDSEQFHRVGGG